MINISEYNIVERNCTKGTLISFIIVNIAPDSTGYRIIALTCRIYEYKYKIHKYQ